jgi:hypothetical protein
LSEYGAVTKLVADFGGLGALVVGMVMVYRLVDKWGGAFLQAQKDQTAATTAQTAAMTALVETVKEGQDKQTEVLVAVRMLSDRMDRQYTYLEAIEGYVKERV